MNMMIRNREENINYIQKSRLNLDQLLTSQLKLHKLPLELKRYFFPFIQLFQHDDAFIEEESLFRHLFHIDMADEHQTFFEKMINGLMEARIQINKILKNQHKKDPLELDIYYYQLVKIFVSQLKHLEYHFLMLSLEYFNHYTLFLSRVWDYYNEVFNSKNKLRKLA